MTNAASDNSQLNESDDLAGDEEMLGVVALLQEKIRSLEDELEKKTTLMAKLKDHFNRVEVQIDTYKEENEQLQEELRKLKKETIMIKGSFQQQQHGTSDTCFDFDKDEADNLKDRDVSSKLQSFLKLFQSNDLNRAQLNLHAVNALVSLYHILFSNDLIDDTTKLVSDSSEVSRGLSCQN